MFEELIYKLGEPGSAIFKENCAEEFFGHLIITSMTGPFPYFLLVLGKIFTSLVFPTVMPQPPEENMQKIYDQSFYQHHKFYDFLSSYMHKNRPFSIVHTAQAKL